MLFSGLIGASLVILTTVFLQFLKDRFEELGDRCDEICASVSSAADISSEYILGKNSEHDARIKEASILGLQERVIGMVVTILPRFTRNDRLTVKECLAEFIDALTSGKFQENTQDSSTSIAVHTTAASLIVALRAAHSRRLTIGGLVVFGQDYREQQNEHWL